MVLTFSSESFRLRREKIYYIIRVQSHFKRISGSKLSKSSGNDGRPEPERDRPFPIEIPVAWGEGHRLTRTRWTQLRDWWLCV